jgi:hypothetical protein
MRFAAALLIVLALAACETHSFPPLQHVTRIDVRTNLDAPITTITDQSQIASVVAFVNARSDKWKAPWYGVPVPTVVANFYREETFLGHFGVGSDFFEIHRSGAFFSRSASDVERREFMKLLAVPFERIASS